MAEGTTSRKRKAAGAAPAKQAATPRRKPTASRRTEVTHAAIARRAYELHLAGHGDPLLNWLTAEQELLRTAG